MRTVVTSFGSTGDVHPYLALAIELKKHNHDPVLAFPPHFASLVERFGLEFEPVGPDLQQVQADLIVAMQVMPDSADELRDMFAPLADALPEMFDKLSEITRDADVIISGPMQPCSRIIHEMTSIPFVSVQENHFGGGGSLAFQLATMSLINPFRAQFGLPPLRHPLTHDANSPQLALYAMSRHITPPPANWPSHYRMTGFFFLDDEQWQPYPGLIDFLAADGPLIVITFGSMTHNDPEALSDIIFKAVEEVGCRAIIQQGWSGLAQRKTPPNIHVAGFIPHSWLFPRAACIVHHGGPGTAAAAFRAGVPSVFVPHTFDQPIWGELAHDLGLVLPIPILELSAERLAKAISMTLCGPRYREIAASIGEKMRMEQGVRTARTLIEELVYRIGLHQEGAEGFRSGFDRGEARGEKMNRRKQFQQQRRLRRRTQGAGDDY